MCGDQPLQHADGVRIPTDGEQRVDTKLDCALPEFLETDRFGACEFVVGELGEGRTAPQAQRVVQYGDGRGRVVVPACLRLVHARAELQGVELMHTQFDCIAGRSRHDRGGELRRAQPPPEPGNIGLQGVAVRVG